MRETTTLPAYSWEELFSFDRLKRAVARRVSERVDALSADEFPVKPEKIAEIVADEWRRAKDAARSSPAAREAALKNLEHSVHQQLDRLLQSDKPELQALGISEKSI
ncbi:MAG: hypothetical protein V1737_00335 [Chloroflexota bacterium]